MKAVIGLGNPGIKYRGTKHNVGFMLLERMTTSLRLKYRTDFRGKVAEDKIGQEKVLFLKPYTYMNLSGISVAELKGYYKLSGKDLLIIHDDMDLPFGKLRFRSKGSAGGHNGIKSVITEIETNEFWRLKIGVGRPSENFDVISHVLSSFNREESKQLEEILIEAEKGVMLWLEGRETEAMSQYNG
ncbi:MAG: aminoacyl-tRNA hydrolase [Eubacteriales bacterium]